MSADGPVVLISGGSRGLGAALVERFAGVGYRTACFSRSESPTVRARRDEDPEGERFVWSSVDSADPAALEGFVAAVHKRWGRLDVLINNAGVGLDGVLATTRPDDIDRTLSVNLGAALHLARAAARRMLRQRSGVILNVSSVNAVRGHTGVVAYSAAKAGLDGMTRSLARELGGRGIRVNSVAPGYFESEMTAHLDEPARARIARRTPLGRLGRAEEVAEALLFLASERASFITGQTLVVDGGLTC